MASNIAVNDDLLQGYDKLVHGAHYRAVIGVISQDFSSCSVETTLPPAGDNKDFKALWSETLQLLPPNECRYAIVDFCYPNNSVTVSKVLLILWSPDSAKVRNKMIYASSQECLLRVMPDIQRQLQAADHDELDYDTILKRITS